MKWNVSRFTKSLGLAAVVLLGLFTQGLPAQLLGPTVVIDPSAIKHLATEISKHTEELKAMARQEAIMIAERELAQQQAKFFRNKLHWQGMPNIIVRIPAPSSYGSTSWWNKAALFGLGAQTGWGNVTVQMTRNPYMQSMRPGTNREYAYAATVDTFDGAGPAALETLGNARTQQMQMAAAIAQLQASALDGSVDTNSQVEQLNLLTASSVQGLQMQQTANTALTSLLEQHTIANKIQRDALADHLNFLNQTDQYVVSEGPGWGNATQAISNYRSQ